jgi:hypothetical protein
MDAIFSVGVYAVRQWWKLKDRKRFIVAGMSSAGCA